MPHRYLIERLKRFLVYRVMHVDDTPRRIAMGLAIGIFVTWTPTIGFQMVLVVALAWLFGANKFVGVPFVWISNPLTALPLYGLNFLVGAWLLPGQYSWADFRTAVIKAVAYRGSVLGRIGAWWRATVDFFLPLWLGSILVGVVLAAITYVLVYRAVVIYRRHWHLRHPGAGATMTALSPGSVPDLPAHLAPEPRGESPGPSQQPPDQQDNPGRSGAKPAPADTTTTSR